MQRILNKIVFSQSEFALSYRLTVKQLTNSLVFYKEPHLLLLWE